VQRLTEQNKSVAQLREQATGADALKKENAELPKLRNEARQLRRKVEELDQLRSENQRLLAASKQTGIANASLPPDFIARASLADAGFGTPEATVQTIFWAATHGNIERVSQCELTPEPNVPDGEKEKLRESIKAELSQFPGFRVAEKKILNDDEVELKVQTTAGGVVQKLVLKRTESGEWKIKQGF
jgi:hypothetical protein